MSNIARLSDYKNNGNNDDPRAPDGKKKRNDYYNGSGGSSGSSGLAVIAPPDPNDEVGSIFNQADKSSGEPSNGLPHLHLIFWANGFQVGEEGEFRTPDTEENKKFIDLVAKGRMPPELLVNGVAPDIHLIDKRTEQYVAPPPPAYTAFSGGGNTMSPSSTSQVQVSTIFKPSTGGASKEPEVDAAAPTCRISVRTADGKRLVGKFNTTHTVRDLQAFIDSQSSNTAAYQLLLGRPPKPIEVTHLSLEAAGLKNQSVMQKLC